MDIKSKTWFKGGFECPYMKVNQEVSKPPLNQSLKSLYHLGSKTSNNALQIANHVSKSTLEVLG